MKDVTATANFALLALNTVKAAVVATLLILLLSVIVANTVRSLNHTFGIILAKTMTVGYSIPGAIIAVGVLGLMTGLDRWLAPLYRARTRRIAAGLEHVAGHADHGVRDSLRGHRLQCR